MSNLPKERFDYLVNSYREWHAFDQSRSAAETRAALERVKETLDAASQVILEYFAGDVDIAGETPTRAAWRAINAAVAEGGMCVDRPLVEAGRVVEILTTWSVAARLASDRMPSKHERSALRMTADRLWATPGFRCTTTKGGPAVAELREIARTAGDKHVTADAALKALKATKPKKS